MAEIKSPKNPPSNGRRRSIRSGTCFCYSHVVAEGARNRGIGLRVQHHVLVDRRPVLKRFGAQLALELKYLLMS